MDGVDYRKYVYDEHYLLTEVGPRFRQTGALDPIDFLMILVWKANRAVSHHTRRLEAKGKCSFNEAVKRIADSLHSLGGRRERLELLVFEWDFALPTATAILTLLYPEEFTIYDIVVCGELNHVYRPNVYGRETLWREYECYHSQVISTAPAELSLRDKDRWLTGRSYHKWLEAKKEHFSPMRKKR